MKPIENLVVEFFKSLRCDISFNGGIYHIENVPKNFEDFCGKKSPYRICFSAKVSDAELVSESSSLVSAISRYLENSGKVSLLKIDFDDSSGGVSGIQEYSREEGSLERIDPLKEIEKVISFKNCEVSNVVKKHQNSYFSRFSFMTTFHYMNEQEKIINEIYVHNGEVVEGDLIGYSIVEGNIEEASTSHLEGDYPVAKEQVKRLLKEKTGEIGKIIEEKLEKEIERIKAHYKNILGELGGNLNGQLKKIQEVELALRVAEREESEVLRNKLNRLKASLVKIGKDDARERVLKEQEFTIKDAMNKHSLNVDNKLINTTVIYYPVFSFDLFLKNDSLDRVVKMNYDPMLKKLESLICDSCGGKISRLNLCSSGHIVCDGCFGKCGECGKQLCKKCLERFCSICGKLLCKTCAIICRGCGKSVCCNHTRKDCVTGEERCISCLRACLRCHEMTEEKYFSESLDGSKICQKCIGTEKRIDVMKKIFHE